MEHDHRCRLSELRAVGVVTLQPPVPGLACAELRERVRLGDGDSQRAPLCHQRQFCAGERSQQRRLRAEDLGELRRAVALWTAGADELAQQQSGIISLGFDKAGLFSVEVFVLPHKISIFK